MATQEQVIEYAAGYGINLTDVPEILLLRANTWIAEQIDSQTIDATQQQYAESAYMLHLLALRPSSLTSAYRGDVKSFSVGDISGSRNEGMSAFSESWLDIALEHLRLGGFEIVPFAGTYR